MSSKILTNNLRFLFSLRKALGIKIVPNCVRSISAKCGSSSPARKPSNDKTYPGLFHFYGEWPADVRREFVRDMELIENFISPEEEMSLVNEAERSMKRLRYQYDHWDNAIHGYREMEKDEWRTENNQILDRIRSQAFAEKVLPHVHILDLAADGIIKPHVDSSRYCGSTIAGLSLLTDCIMRLRRVDESKYKQGREGDDTPVGGGNKPERQFEYYVDALLERRSLYICEIQ